VASDIIDEAGIVVEPDIQVDQTEAEEPSNETPQQEADSKKRLSVYEDFLQNLDFDDQEDETGDEPLAPDSPDSPNSPEDK
jgi:hypothetical protein